MSENKLIELEIDKFNNLAILFLNRPTQFNALSYKLAEDL